MIYLDSAATTFQKPLSVSYAMQRAMRTMSSPGRGGYAAARAAEETAFRCRSLAAELFGVPSPEQVVFTSNATHALNIAIRSLVPEGGRVAVSGYEHNAVTRPLHALGARIKVAAAPLFDRAALLRAFENSISPELDAVVCTHVSNVFGFVLPIEETADALAQRGFALRSGLHCAPYAHRTVGTLPNGTVRLSVSAFTSAADIDAFAHVLRSIVRG